jgi:hypothetical protein
VLTDDQSLECCCVGSGLELEDDVVVVEGEERGKRLSKAPYVGAREKSRLAGQK